MQISRDVGSIQWLDNRIGIVGKKLVSSSRKEDCWYHHYDDYYYWTFL